MSAVASWVNASEDILRKFPGIIYVFINLVEKNQFME